MVYFPHTLAEAHREKVQSMVLIHVHVHHLQQCPHLLKSHLAVFVFVRFLKPVPDPPEMMLRATVSKKKKIKKKEPQDFLKSSSMTRNAREHAFPIQRILIQPLLLIHGLSLVNQLPNPEDPGLSLLRWLCHEVQVSLASVEHQREAEFSGKLFGNAQQNLRLVAFAHGLHFADGDWDIGFGGSWLMW